MSDKDNDILSVMDEIEEDESGVSGESFKSSENDIEEDLIEELEEEESIDKIQEPFRIKEDADPFPSETPSFDPEKNINLSNENEPPQSADNTPDDLVDDLEIEDDDNDDDFDDDKVEDSGSFAPSKAMSKSKKTMQLVAVIGGAVLLIAVMFLPSMSKKKKDKDTQEEKIVDTEQVLKDMKNYTGEDLRRQEVRKYKSTKEQLEADKENKHGKIRKHPKPDRSRRSGRRSGNKGSNYRRDKSIIDKYQQVNPEHASGTAGGTASDTSGGQHPGSMMNLPQRRGKGGLNIIGGGSSKSSDKKAGIYNLELKAFLKFGVRSTSGSQIVAILKQDKGPFRKGDLFYGTASFRNKRTFISFNKAVSGGNEIDLKGRALFGRDPGIPSEVTEIATGNASNSAKSAVIGVAGKVADKALSRVTAGTTDGALSEPTSDLQGQHEKEKEQYEYFVPANTTFTIYVY